MLIIQLRLLILTIKWSIEYRILIMSWQRKQITVSTIQSLSALLIRKKSNNKPLLVLISGCPGSGKSTLSFELLKVLPFNCEHYEADQYFLTSEGYSFNANKLPDAHNYCLSSTDIALSNGISVIVSNTFTKDWEIKKYIDLGYNTVIIQCLGEFDNIHDCPKYVVDKMKENLKTRKTNPDILYNPE